MMGWVNFSLRPNAAMAPIKRKLLLTSHSPHGIWESLKLSNKMAIQGGGDPETQFSGKSSNAPVASS